MRSVAFGLICFLLGLVGGMGAISHSQVRLEAAAGQCKATGHGEGQWWIGGGDTFTSDPLISQCYQFGLSKLSRNGLGWRVSWVDLGQLSLKEYAWGGRYADGTLGPQPHWTSDGFGSVRGMSFGGVFEKSYRGVFATAEGGAYLYRSQFGAIADHRSSNTAVWTEPDARYGTAMYYGAGLGYRKGHADLTASFRSYPKISFNQLADNFDTLGPSRASVNVLMVSARWSF